ncbi:hypothetical protein AVEN_249042-1, partial [Araneus ventricosus]
TGVQHQPEDQPVGPDDSVGGSPLQRPEATRLAAGLRHVSE